MVLAVRWATALEVAPTEDDAVVEGKLAAVMEEEVTEEVGKATVERAAVATGYAVMVVAKVAAAAALATAAAE